MKKNSIFAAVVAVFFAASASVSAAASNETGVPDVLQGRSFSRTPTEKEIAVIKGFADVDPNYARAILYQVEKCEAVPSYPVLVFSLWFSLQSSVSKNQGIYASANGQEVDEAGLVMPTVEECRGVAAISGAVEQQREWDSLDTNKVAKQ